MPTDDSPEKQPSHLAERLEAADESVAECHDRDGPAARAAAARWWRDVPRISGAELAWALRRLGLEARIGGPDHAVLMRGREAIALVPLKDDLHPAIVRSLLQSLGITPEQLAEFLASP